MNIIDLYDKYDNLYYVGGIVRDTLLKKVSPDIDITIVGNAIEFCKSLGFGEIVQTNPEFGTVRMLVNNQFYDFASTRKEIYEKKGHLPKVVEIGCSLEEDIKRRDFTVNSLARNTKTGEIIDYTGGLLDLKNKKLRIHHNESFIDDPTRIIRGLKFAVRLGFELDDDTKFFQDEYLANINYDMSYKRVKDELISTFNLNSNKAYEEFFKQNIYKLITKKEVTPIKYDIAALINGYFKEIKNIWLIYIALVDTEMLELTKQENDIVQDYKTLLNFEINDDFQIIKNFENRNIESLILYEIIKQNGFAIKYLDELKSVKLQINGDDLKNIGIEPSPKYSEILDYVLRKKLENRKMTKEEELNIINATFVTDM